VLFRSDVDGVTSVSILLESIKRLDGKVSFFIPDRLKDGYGFSLQGVAIAQKRKATLIITVDCGITATLPIKQANTHNIDVIVCDHHKPMDVLPPAYAILNPKKEICQYPFKELAGCGIAFKLLQGLCNKLEINKSFLFEYLDFVALGTASDIVSLTNENRIFVKHGMELIDNGNRIGLKTLLKNCSIKQSLTVSIIVFRLAPIINAVGRISNAKKAVHLLTTTRKQQAKNIANILSHENVQRRELDQLVLKEAVEQIQHSIDLDNTKIIVLDKEDWHLGVIGIVAARIQEKYNRPTVIISTYKGIICEQI